MMRTSIAGSATGFRKCRTGLPRIQGLILNCERRLLDERQLSLENHISC
jgi:hypothetical protein